jgi:membrane fusion protein, multidrug efflux system
MAFRIRGSYLVAIGITAGLLGWMATGDIEWGGNDAEGTPPIAEREAERSSELFKVNFLPLRAEERVEQVKVHGRTQADATIPIRAETAGILEERLVNKGDQVKAGDLVCRIDAGAREAEIAKAKAALAQAEADHEANARLVEQGFAAQNRLNQLKAALDAARAGLAQAELELARTEVHAKAAGTVQDPIAETGDMLTMGGTCVTLIDTDPMLFIGQVSERDISKVIPGRKADITLVSGETIEGEVRYVSPSADAQTRTFRVEIVLPNADGKIRDGLTASAVIKLEATVAFRVLPSWITLADSGEIGLKTIDENDTVHFEPVNILEQTKQGIWISGPEPGHKVVTFGQEYVQAGDKVAPFPDESFQAAFEGRAPEEGDAQ